MTEMNQEIIVPESKIATSSTGDAIDLSGEINFYHQTTSDNCAGTCACMCVKNRQAVTAAVRCIRRNGV